MRDEKLSFRHSLSEFNGLHISTVFDIQWSGLRSADLGEYIGSPALPGPSVDSMDQSIEGQLKSDGHKNHKTVPAKCGPSGLAKCVHCVSQRSACRPIMRPDI